MAAELPRITLWSASEERADASQPAAQSSEAEHSRAGDLAQLLQGSFTGRDSDAARQVGFARRQELVQGSDNLGDGSKV